MTLSEIQYISQYGDGGNKNSIFHKRLYINGSRSFLKVKIGVWPKVWPKTTNNKNFAYGDGIFKLQIDFYLI